MKMSREKFEADRESYWKTAKAAVKAEETSAQEAQLAVIVSLLADIHAMLEHAIIEPHENEDDVITVDFTEVDA